MSRCHTPDFSFPLSPEQELLRYNSPESYPCYTECGYYRSTADCICKALCCCMPKLTPKGDDSPKWSAVVAARTKDPAAFVPFPQPKFEDKEPQVATPFKEPRAAIVGLHATGRPFFQPPRAPGHDGHPRLQHSAGCEGLARGATDQAVPADSAARVRVAVAGARVGHGSLTSAHTARRSKTWVARGKMVKVTAIFGAKR